MAQSHMEERLENLDRRLWRVEQILPTLATKDDLQAFATKVELEQLESRQRALTEHVIEQVKLVFEAVTALDAKVDRRLTGVDTGTAGLRFELDHLVRRLEARNVI